MNSLVVIFVLTLVILAILGLVCWIKCKLNAKKIAKESFDNMKINEQQTEEQDEEQPEEDDEEEDVHAETKSILRNENSPPSEKSVSFKEFDVMNIGKTNSSAYSTIETYNKYDPKYNDVFDTTF